MITPIDPIFMCIPILDIMRQRTSESEGRFLGLQDIFESDQYTSLRHLAQLFRIDQHLALVCHVRESTVMGGGSMTFRLDNERTLAWLKRKVQVLVDKFSSIPSLVNSIAYTESLPPACRTGKNVEVYSHGPLLSHHSPTPPTSNTKLIHLLLSSLRVGTCCNMTLEAITQSALKLVSGYLSDSWATQLAAEYP